MRQSATEMLHGQTRVRVDLPKGLTFLYRFIIHTQSDSSTASSVAASIISVLQRLSSKTCMMLHRHPLMIVAT
jgi:hypothetical protein